MNVIRILGVLLLVLPVASVHAGESPRIAGLHNRHPLEAEEVGVVLISELRCGACHVAHAEGAFRGFRGFPVPPAPELEGVRARVSADFLRQFIADPAATDPGTVMPNLLDHLPPEQRRATAADITDFLLSLGDVPFARAAVDPKEAAFGKDLYHRVGCVACHAPRREDGEPIAAAGSVSLVHVPRKYGLRSLAGFLFRPHAARPAGRMPDMRLTRREAARIASYLIAGAGAHEPAHDRPRTPPDNLDATRVARGKAAFIQHGCAACHPLEALGKEPAYAGAPSWSEVDPSRGCLDPRARETPRFGLDATQTAAIRAALARGLAEPDASTKLEIALTTFNCLACHTRGNHGGPSQDRNPYFTTDEPNLGDHGRIPPTLTLTGAKLKTLWLQKVLFDGEAVRPYMHTRMPQFGEANIGHLPALFDRVDHLDPVEMPEPGREQRRTYRDAGHQLLGDKGLNCITCHNFNGLKSPGFKGMDLMTSFERLEPAWFDRFMRSPEAMRPGIVMPTFWPDGKAAFNDILGGDTDEQIRAIWYTFSLGRSARPPSGIRSTGTTLAVTDRTRVYRGRSGIAGYRGIAVGFPGGWNYAFNAQTGAMSGLWRGDFISVNWRGQGSGNFNPAERAVALAQDVAFCRLGDDEAPWPLRPVMTKERPVNPDPLYPRNHGYRFLGYALADGIPTFRYRSGDVEIADRSIVQTDGGRAVLHRTLRFSAPAAETLWFRALTGAFETEGRVHRLGKLTLTVPPTPLIARTSVRPLDNGRELLLELRLPAGESSLEITYDVQP